MKFLVVSLPIVMYFYEYDLPVTNHDANFIRMIHLIPFLYKEVKTCVDFRWRYLDIFDKTKIELDTSDILNF